MEVKVLFNKHIQCVRKSGPFWPKRNNNSFGVFFISFEQDRENVVEYVHPDNGYAESSLCSFACAMALLSAQNVANTKTVDAYCREQILVSFATFCALTQKMSKMWK